MRPLLSFRAAPSKAAEDHVDRFHDAVLLLDQRAHAFLHLAFGNRSHVLGHHHVSHAGYAEDWIEIARRRRGVLFRLQWHDNASRQPTQVIALDVEKVPAGFRILEDVEASQVDRVNQNLRCRASGIPRAFTKALAASSAGPLSSSQRFSLAAATSIASRSEEHTSELKSLM